MLRFQRMKTAVAFAALLLGCCMGQAQSGAAPTAAGLASQRDGSHDFDFEIGTWKTRLKRLAHPLTGSTQWVECEGVTSVRKVWKGRANLVELEADCPGSHFQALNLRLYNPNSHNGA